MIRNNLVAGILLLSTAAVQANDIDGNWQTSYGQIAAVSNGAITLKTGKYAGRRIGYFNEASGNNYSGTITDPFTGASYSGKATVSGNKLRMTGCIMKVVCRVQIWIRNE